MCLWGGKDAELHARLLALTTIVSLTTHVAPKQCFEYITE